MHRLLRRPTTVTACAAVFLFFAACEKEDCYEAREACPIPTSIPAETCEGAHTLGFMADSLLFVANYAPNNDGIGRSVPRGGGVKAWINQYGCLRIEAVHAIRPAADDYDENGLFQMEICQDTLASMSLDYTDRISDTDLSSKVLPGSFSSFTLEYSLDRNYVCGTFSADMTNTGTFRNSYNPGGTTKIRNGRFDIEF